MALDTLRATLKANVDRLVGGRRPGETRMQLAKRIGVGDGTLGRLIGENANPRLTTLAQLAAALKVDIWQLLAPAEHASGRIAEPSAHYPVVDSNALADAVLLAEEAINLSGRLQLSPAARTKIVLAAMRIQAEGVGTESARQVVADLLSAMNEATTDGPTGGRTSRRARTRNS